MPVARVQINGRIARIEVPAGTTPEQAQAMAERMADATPAPKPTSFWQGLAEGMQKPATNALRAMEYLNPIAGVARNVTQIANAASREQVQSPVAAAAQAIDRRADVAKARSPYRGSTAGRLVGGIIGTAPTAFIPGGPVIQGVAAGALMNEDGSAGGLLRDAAIGGVAGKAGQLVGKYALAPVAERIGRTRPARLAGAKAVAAFNAVTGRNAEQLPLPRPGPGDRMVNKMAPELADVRQTIADAQRLGLPMSLADTHPNLRALAGSVTRFSPDARVLAESNYGPRALGQADRAVNAIDQHLAPITNIEERAAQIRQTARTASDPFYQQAKAAAAPADDDLLGMLNTPDGKAALASAYRIAHNEGRDPAELGFVLDENGGVSLKDIVTNEAGRFGKVPLGNERNELSRTTVRAWNGAEIPKVGPTDLVGYLRLRGGLADQGNELSHMGLTNAPRRLDFVGQEARFGPLINEKGMNLDDAAYAAWEAGYFPHHAERPSVNEFLDALRSTHEGRERAFLPEDMPQVERFYGAQEQKAGLQQQRFETGNTLRDKSYDAGEDRPFAPLDAIATERPVQYPTYETLDLVKRGFDAHLNQFRNQVTGKLDLEGNPLAGSVEGLRQRFVAKLDELNPSYQTARNVYADNIKPRTALRQGYDMLPKNNLPQRQFDSAVSGMDERSLAEARRGYATSMADQVAKQRLSANPYESIIGSPLQQQKVGALFPQGADDFSRIYGLEKEMAATKAETLGGSQTQPRNIADQQFQGGLPSQIIDGAVQLGTSGGLSGATGLLRAVGRKIGDRGKLGLFDAEKKAAEMAPRLLDTENPQAVVDYLDKLARDRMQAEARRRAYARVGELLALPAAGIGVASSR